MIQTAKRIQVVEEYYFSKKLAEVRGLDLPTGQAGSPELRVINLGIGSPDMAPATTAINALIDSAKNSANHGYQNYKGIPQLRKAIADFYNRTYTVSLDVETMILPLMGSKEGIMHISMAFVNEGEEVLIPDPGYPTYSSVTNLVGGKIRTYDLKEDLNWGVDIEALEKADLSNVKIMWINFPHMPTGRIASREELKALVDLARKNNFLIVNDNPYSLILNDNPISILSIEGAADVALELNSLSKSHNMAGWRIGWVAGKKELIDAVLKVKSNMDSGMFLGLQHAAIEALNSDKNWFTELNTIYKQRRTAAHKILDLLNCTYSSDQSGLFVWAKAPDSITDVEKFIDEILYGTKVFITPGFIFGKAGSRYIRIALCSPVEKMNEAAERIAKFTQAKLTPNSMNVTIIGLGLIGGSIAFDLKKSGVITTLTGIDRNTEHTMQALELGIVDTIDAQDKSIATADLLILAIPVSVLSQLLPSILDVIKKDAVVIDTGSTKGSVCKAVANHPNRSQFVAAHPIAGTENSGPTAAFSGLFQNKTNIICEKEKSSTQALAVAEKVFAALGMNTIYMEAGEHDKHVAYVSHLSHVSSFLLGQTVLDIERDEKNIFALAGSGFSSTVRLAKSSPDMWAPIFEQNAEHLSQALLEYIMHLQKFQYYLMKRDGKELHKIMKEANRIREVLNGIELKQKQS